MIDYIELGGSHQIATFHNKYVYHYQLGSHSVSRQKKSLWLVGKYPSIANEIEEAPLCGFVSDGYNYQLLCDWPHFNLNTGAASAIVRWSMRVLL